MREMVEAKETLSQGLLTQLARELNIRVGVCPALPLTEGLATLRQLQVAGTYPPFAEKDIDRRADPEAVLKGAASIIAVAVPHQQHSVGQGLVDSLAARGSMVGFIAAFALGEDYHRVVGRKLEAVISRLREIYPTAGFAAHVDSGPALERSIAARTGIGSIGRSGLLVTPEYGAQIYLGLIYTTLNPPLDFAGFQGGAPEGSGTGCSDCGACARACPAGIIPPAGRAAEMKDYNPYRCVSYLTQRKGFIPRDLRPLMGRMIYGCDACQWACSPLETEGEVSNEVSSGSPDEVNTVDLPEFLTVSSGEFSAGYGKTAAGWRGRTTLQRNAIIVLGNSGNPEALDVLIQQVSDERPVIRGHAAWAIAEVVKAQTVAGEAGLRSKWLEKTVDRGREALSRALLSEDHERVRDEIHEALKILTLSYKE